MKLTTRTLTLLLAAAISLDAQTLTILHRFSGPDGAHSYAPLIQGTDGGLYGTTYDGGLYGAGTIFKITPSGDFGTFYNFCSQPLCADGSGPFSGLTLALNGDYYGTTGSSGAHGGGTIFKISEFTTVYSFCSLAGCTDGQAPEAGLFQAGSGDFYGTTVGGGLSGDGTIFSITPGGSLTTLHSFCSQAGCADGSYPGASLVQASNGELYGTTGAALGGNLMAMGTLFEISPGGALTTLRTFCSHPGCASGKFPYAGLIQAADGDLYGTTYNGGAGYEGGL